MKSALGLVLTMTVLLAALVAVGVLVIDRPAINAEDCTAERRGPRRPKPPQVKLERPLQKTVVVSAPGENIRNFHIAGDKLISRSRAAVSSEVVAVAQDEDSQLLNADVRLKARAIGRGADVQLEVCATRGGWFSAGTYTGTVSIYGPKVEEFRYEVAVTQRWYPLIPVLLLLGTASLYLILVWRSTLPPGSDDTRGEKVAFAAVAVGGMALTYFTVYMSNPTWGDAVPSDPAGLITGAATSAGVATAAAVRMRETAKKKDGTKKEEPPAEGEGPAPGGADKEDEQPAAPAGA